MPEASASRAGASQPNCSDQFAILFLATLPYDCQPDVAATPRSGIMLGGGATDWTDELSALINLGQLRGYYVRAAAEGIFEVEENLTGRCVCHGTAA
jgi:hypothetical protein